MKRTVAIVTGIALNALLAASSYAGEQVDYVGYYATNQGNSGKYFAFSLNGWETLPPGCNALRQYIVDTTTNYGKNAMTAIIAAKASNLKVHVWGTNTCPVGTQGEWAGGVSVGG